MFTAARTVTNLEDNLMALTDVLMSIVNGPYSVSTHIVTL